MAEAGGPAQVGPLVWPDDLSRRFLLPDDCGKQIHFYTHLNREMFVNKFQSPIQFLMAIAVFTLVGCNNDRVLPPPTEAEFSTGAFSVPFPSDVFMTYAALNEFALISAGAPGAEFTNTPIIPSAEVANDTGDVLVAQGFLDGFSVTSPMQLDFTHNLDPSTVVGGQSVRVFEIVISPPSASAANPDIGAPIAMPAQIIRELQADSDYTVTMARSVGYQMVVRPRVPWPASDNVSLGGASRGILVAVTNDVRDFRGNRIIRSDQYDRMANGIPSATGNTSVDGFADAVGAMVGNSLLMLAGQGINPADVVVTNTFTCQSVTDVLDTAVALTVDGAPFATTPAAVPGDLEVFSTVGDYLTAVEVISSPDDLPYNPTLQQGTITLPTFYPGDENPANWGDAVTGYLNNADGGVVYQTTSDAPNAAFPTRYDPVPSVQGSSEIPVLICTPNADTPKPAEGWPVIIFQHGITRSRFDMLAMAPLFCNAGSGMAMVAMDAPLHGSDEANPYAAQVGQEASKFGMQGIERTFGIDLINNETGEPVVGGDGFPDPSGTYFLNFPSLISSRSVWTQAVCDLAGLTETLPTWDIDGDGSADFSDEVFYVGQSLGGLIGSTFLSAVGPGKIKAAELNVAGGHIAKLLENSPNYNPRLVAFFEGQGVVQGSTTAEQAVNVISAIADGIDPITHVRRAAANTSMHMSFTVGGNPADNKLGYFPPDLVVPVDTLGTGFYADYIGMPISAIPTSGSIDDRPYTGLVEPSYLGGGLPMARIASIPKATPASFAETVFFPGGFTPSLSVGYTEGDHGVLADPTSLPGFSMQISVTTLFASTSETSPSGGVNVTSTVPNGFNASGLDPYDVIDSTDVSIPIEAGETLLGTVTISRTGDPADPVSAVFDTNGEAGSLAAAAAAYNAHHFNWLQVVHSDALPPNAPSDDIGAVGPVVSSPRISPPSGGSGQTEASAQNGVFADDKPLLWNEIQTPPGEFAADQTTVGAFYSVKEFTDNVDAPAPEGVDPSVGDPSQQTQLFYEVGPWVGDIAGLDEAVEVRVWLVAVDINGDPVRYLRGFSYQQGENSITGSPLQVISGIAEMPGSPGTTGDSDDLLVPAFNP